jgi:hypothetical protein
VAVPAGQYIWANTHGRGRNQYVAFRKTFELADGMMSVHGTLHLFADTRYRLMVNGQTVGHGPARFKLEHPTYDTYALDRYLRPGRNVVAVMVNSYGAASFHSTASRGGLIAWGQMADGAGQTQSLATDATWRTLVSAAHRSDTMKFSFALNAAEVLDARRWPAGWANIDFDDGGWAQAQPLADTSNWGPLTPRPIALLDESVVEPVKMLGAWVGRQADEDIYSLLVTMDPAVAPVAGGNQGKPKAAVWSQIFSPREQTITFGAWWGDYYVNGEKIPGKPRDDMGWRQDRTVRLRQGWNSFLLTEAMHGDVWDFYLALPKSAGLVISAEPKAGGQAGPDTFLIGGPWPQAQIDAGGVVWPLKNAADLPSSLGPWQHWARGKEAGLPLRERAWRLYERLPDPRRPMATLRQQAGTGALTLLYDFGTEVLGRPRFDFSASAGTTITVSYTERLRPDGLADVHAKHFVDMVDRYTAVDGRQTWHVFHPRGFRYLEVQVQGGDPMAFDLHEVALTRAQYPVDHLGSFACSDPKLTRIWAVGRDTAQACMEDAYLDCPWRERGVYVGDLLVEYHVNLASFGDHRLYRRSVELFVQGQGAQGAIPGLAHASGDGPPLDYAALLPQLLRAWWQHTGDREFLTQSAPALERLLAGIEALQLKDGSGLYGVADSHPYIDSCRMDRGGVNCALNCFYKKAMESGAEVLEVLGRTDKARLYRARSEELAAAMRKAFWDDSRGVFTDRPVAENSSPSMPGNVLALRWGVAEAKQVEAALPYVMKGLAENLTGPAGTQGGDCNINAYFSYYALDLLYRLGKVQEAEDYMRRCWGQMLDAGAWTFWEYFLDTDSRCHAWSASPTYFLSSKVLGVEFPVSGDPTRIEIAPRPGSLTWAEGDYPLPALGAGQTLHVRWERHGQDVKIEFQAPPGVTVTTRAPAACAAV